jgi:hypothetical protein
LDKGETSGFYRVEEKGLSLIDKDEDFKFNEGYILNLITMGDQLFSNGTLQELYAEKK